MFILFSLNYTSQNNNKTNLPIKENINFDTCKFTKDNFIYKVGRVFSYLLIFNNDTNYLNLIVDKKCFFNQTSIQYNYMKYDKDDNSIETTGIVEDKDRLWIHPPRLWKEAINFAPFVQVLYGKKKWTQRYVAFGNKLTKDKRVILKNRYKQVNDTIIKSNNKFYYCMRYNITTQYKKLTFNSEYYLNKFHGLIFWECELFNGDKIKMILLEYGDNF